MTGLLAYTVSQAETIRITAGEWPPYVSKDSRHYGFSAHVVEEAFAQEGVKVEWGFFSWHQALALVQQGDWDGSIIWSKTEERAKGIVFSPTPLMHLKDVFFHRKDFPFEWKKIEDLVGLNIGATETYSYGEEFESAERDGVINVQRAANDVINFQRLLRGKIDIYGSTMPAGYVILDKEFAPAHAAQLTNHPKAYREATYHLVLNTKSEKNRRFMELFESGLNKLAASGKLEQIENNLLAGEYDK